MQLYRRGKSPVWWCDFRHQGRRIRKSTGTTDRQEAQEYADRLKANLWRLARLGERAVITWNAAVLDWLDAHKHLRTLSDRKDQLRFASTWLSGKPLTAIDQDVLDALGKRKEATGVAPATVNRLLAAVSAVLGHAFKKGGITVKPPIPKRHEPQKRIRWATQEQARRLVAALPPHLAAMVEFSLATGLRQFNVTHLEWSQVDIPRRLVWIHADQAKGKHNLSVHLSEAAVAVLQRQVGKHERWVFPYRGAPIKQPTQAAWLAAVDAAGLGDFHWHDLRHTWASWHVQNGTPIAVLQELGGWRDMKMVLRYAHLAPGHLAPYAGNSGLVELQDTGTPREQNRTHSIQPEHDEDDEILFGMNGVADGIRTHDNRNHNPGLYQLSYSHRCCRRLPRAICGAPDRTRTCYPRLRRPVLYPNELRAPDALRNRFTVWSG
jgi:integrase